MEALNEDVLDQLVDAVAGDSGGGPLILLTAPRAGYGKTHLLGRIAAARANESVMVPLAFRAGDALILATLARRGMESLAQAPAEYPGWSRLRESCAHVVTLLLHRLIDHGQLNCANPSQALKVLEGPVEEVFSEQGKARVIGDWVRKNRDSLKSALAILASKSLPVRAELLDGWLAAMLDQSLEGGQAGLAEMQELALADAEIGTPVWLRLLSIWRPVVLLVDHLDGLYRNPQAGVTIATLLMDLVDYHQVHVLLCLNQDVWQATFGHHLPSALEDRLTASQVLLRGLTEADAESLLRLRLSHSGLDEELQKEFESFVSVKRHFLGRPVGSVSARAFLRHCARQWDIFQAAPATPSEPDSSDWMPDLAMPEAVMPDVTEDESCLPLKTETISESALVASLPALFDHETVDQVQVMAEGLAEPRPALPQDEPAAVSESLATATESPTETPDESPAQLVASSHNSLLDGKEDRLKDWKSIPSTPSEVTPTAPSPDAFVKLREMLSRLRQPGDKALLPSANGSPLKPAPEAGSSVDASTPKSLLAEVAKPVPDDLPGRFQALRLQMSAEAQAQPLDYQKLADLIRLAGRRFPLVRYSQHELPGLTGSYVMYWALQGVEILFGLAPLSDQAYWRTLSGFAAGRQADLASLGERECHRPADFKIVTFRSDREQTAWQNLMHSGLLPAPTAEVMDCVFLDAASLASLYAMQRIIKEAEFGTLQAEPTQVMSVLARELDFFWKRITRVSAVA